MNGNYLKLANVVRTTSLSYPNNFQRWLALRQSLAEC